MNVIERFRTVILHQIPLTRVRLFFARILYSILHRIIRKDVHLIRRKGVLYEVDLSEGIDLSLFLFGNFQNYITDSKLVSIPADAQIFDIGANIGSMALRFAQLTPQGHVYAFEPTPYAFDKLVRNISLNPQLAQRITPVQLFVSDQNRKDPQIKAYASWKVDGCAADKHPVHGGIIKPAESVAAITLDDFCFKNEIQKIDLIKIDTDGHEFQALAGARNAIEKYLPDIIFEVGGYVMQEHFIDFDQYMKYFGSLGYILWNLKTRKEITPGNYTTQIPSRSTTDIIAKPGTTV